MLGVETKQRPFSELPTDIDFEKSGEWSFGCRRYAEFVVTRGLADGTAEEYELPRSIGLMLEIWRRHGKEEALLNVRIALGVHQ